MLGKKPMEGENFHLKEKKEYWFWGEDHYYNPSTRDIIGKSILLVAYIMLIGICPRYNSSIKKPTDR